MNTRNLLRTAALVAGIGLAVGPGTAIAQNARNLGDLVGARAAGGQTELEVRGFTFINERETYGDSVEAYYWNRGSKTCVRVETYDGHFRSITDASASDCNQRASSSNRDRNTAAAIIGAAAIAAALAHKNNQHTNAGNNGAQWDIGYNDGLHGVPYHNVARSDAYATGYDAGVQQRSRNTSYHSGRGGYSSAPNFRNVVGQGFARGIDMMSEMGFRDVDTISSGDTTYGIYYHPASRTCVQLTMANGQVLSADDIKTHPKCR
ncbi:hypothetical protein [Thermomonas mangrovi]|uniref:hypothetical protein n=1 Tax=Thermomonas mangrovi TaxID=2993316 RepID=UPI00230732FE|nr:hypothetical protein [Thermomonas mangrovi]